jgi:hypothetical protein
MNLDARIRAEHEFRERAQVMVSTEAGGEGINLQFCALMVNYDIPWNPNRLEQRMGRIHRYGQQKEVHIYNLVAADTREGRVLDALFRKLERIQGALGSDRVFDVIGDVLPGRSLKDLIVEAIANRRTLDDIVAEIEAIPDDEAMRKAREAVLEGLATRHIDLQRVLGEDRRARENRLVPEYIERFFERACRFASVPLERRRDGLWRTPSVPYEIRNVPLEFKHRFGEVFREYSKLAFDKQTAHRHEAIFIAPGHPLLEAIIERILAQSAEDVHCGAAFADPDDKLDGWLWFVEGEVRDGVNAVAGKRLFAIYQPVQGEVRLINSSVLWDVKPVGARHALPLQTVTSSSENTIIAYAIEQVLESYRTELLQQRERDAVIKRKYGLRSLEQMILDAEAKLIEYETRRVKVGAQHAAPVPDVEIQNEERRKEELKARKQALEEEIRRETSLLPSTPNVLGVVRVLPQPSSDEAMRSDAEIEAKGMQVAMDYERAQGRLPEDVSAQNLGYDIRSVGATHASPLQQEHDSALQQLVRHIEVKARATTGAIALTPNEWLMAHRLGDDYWLYVVENAVTVPTLHTIQNPATKLKPEEVVEVVRYVVKDWRQSSKDEERQA